MKNPFPDKVQAVESTRLLGHGLWRLQFPGGGYGTKEQAEYAAHAINQHEKLVAVVRCLLLSADAAWEADAGGHDWPEACQLARALLKEEKT